jgi:hypothetical protein
VGASPSNKSITRRFSMKISSVCFDVNSFGITQRSLKILRDTITKNNERKILVIELPTDNICCGFMIFVQNKDGIEVIWTGDGFRTDGGGEGSAGYNTAETIFYLYRIRPLLWEKWEGYEKLYTASEEVIKQELLQVANSILQTVSEDDFVIPIESKPPYIRR